MKTMFVKANGHGPVPRFENGTRYIEDTPVEVVENSYYLRRISDGELVVVQPPAAPAPAPAKAKE